MTDRGNERDKMGWYLALMAPRTKSSKAAWLDPTAMYRDPQAMSDCARDLLKPFDPDEFDIVAGIDSAGYIMGSYIAAQLHKGFLAIRKAGHLCVETDSVGYSDYCETQKALEVRKKPFEPGTRVLIVDQWMETGGTMTAAVEIVENHQGIVAGIASICIEENEKSGKSKALLSKYKWSSCCPDALQQQVNDHYLESFKTYKD